jgi:2-aminophenol/2-amino-5-chlorophenol 1,6-dioxygenase alpha subunit
MTALRAAALVPGLPHLLAAESAPGWQRLAQAMRELGDELRSLGVESLVVTSTQWISVLGVQVQMRPEIAGTRVDENWYRYDYGTLDHCLRTDVSVAERWLQALRSDGFQARPTDHPHFPIDTGIVVAARLLDPEGRFRIAQASLNLYGSADSVERLGAAAARAVEDEGRPAALVAIGGLSSHPLRAWIEPRQDAIASAADEAANQRVLTMLGQGDVAALFSERDAISRTAAMDGQLRTLAFLHGGAGLARPARVHAYSPVWGMGAAVISWLSTGNDELHRSKP